MEENEMRRLLISVSVVLLVCGFAQATLAPPAGSLVWLTADAGVVQSGGVVQTWQDQSGNGNDATRVKGTMSLGTAAFGYGTHDVIHFNKDGYFSLNTAPLRLADLTVYAVVEVTGADRRAYFSTYSNAAQWGYGYHLDLEGGSIRAMTSDGTQANSSDWLAPAPAPGMHYITTAMSSTAGSKEVYADGVLQGAATVPGLGYYMSGETASIGALGQLDIDYFFFSGDIAEILVYSSVDFVQRYMVEDYLYNKYYVPEPATMTLLGFGALAMLRRRRHA